jgi:DNA-binding NarL/FixJ family response regulator
LEKPIAEKPDLITNGHADACNGRWGNGEIARANPETKNIPILATTVLFGPLEVKMCLEAACDGYIVKPFTVMELRRQIEELLVSPIGAV